MTTIQKQCLLCYLGFYTGDIDGIFGPATRAATAAFQESVGLEADGIFGPATGKAALLAVSGDFWAQIEYFQKDEFRCRCGGKYCDGFPAQPDWALVRTADSVRKHFAAPCTVSSGVRCEKHNAAVGGVQNSRHRLGKAMDFSVRGKSASEVLAYVKTLPQVRYAYAIDASFVHMDVS